MNEKCITIQSRLLPISGPEVDELENLCKQNNIRFQNILYRTDGLDIQASVLQPLITLFLSDSLIHEIAVGIAAGIASAAIWDAIKKLFVKYTHKEQIELQTRSAHLRIESDRFTDEAINKAFATVAEVSKATYNEDRPIIPIYVVVKGDNDIEVMKQNDFIWKYVAHKKPDEGDENHGQP